MALGGVGRVGLRPCLAAGDAPLTPLPQPPQLPPADHRCFCPAKGPVFSPHLGRTHLAPAHFFVRKMPCSKKKDTLTGSSPWALLPARFCLPQGRGSVRGEPLRVPPLAFSHPPAGDHFCRAKVLLQKERHP